MDVFFLGGGDLEMQTIREVLSERGAEFSDLRLSWGAKASAYANVITKCLCNGQTPVLIELVNDLDPSIRVRCEVIDHHGEMAGRDRPTALEQVAKRIGITKSEFEFNRWWMLVAANDRGHIRGMKTLVPPASDVEIREVRTRDMAAQGVTPDLLEAARQSIENARELVGGRLTVVSCPNDRTGLVAEFMEKAWGGPGFKNLFVRGATEVAFYGSGELVASLAARSPAAPAAWFGGSLPEFGFWGARSSALSFSPITVLEAEVVGGKAGSE